MTIEIIEIEVNHRPRVMGKSNYGFERVFRVLIDLIFVVVQTISN